MSHNAHRHWCEKEAAAPRLISVPCYLCIGGYVGRGWSADGTHEKVDRCRICAGTGYVLQEKETT